MKSRGPKQQVRATLLTVVDRRKMVGNRRAPVGLLGAPNRENPDSARWTRPNERCMLMGQMNGTALQILAEERFTDVVG